MFVASQPQHSNTKLVDLNVNIIFYTLVTSMCYAAWVQQCGSECCICACSGPVKESCRLTRLSLCIYSSAAHTDIGSLGLRTVLESVYIARCVPRVDVSVVVL